MPVIVELETEHGSRVYLNPAHVVSVLSVIDTEVPMTVVEVANGTMWRVLGGARDVACHLFGETVTDEPRCRIDHRG